jgi:hypothetical protein
MKIYVEGKELAKRPKEVEKILNEASDYLSKKAFEPITIIDVADHDAEKDAEIKKLKDEILCLTVCPNFDKVDLDLAKEAGDEQKRRAEIAERALKTTVRKMFSSQIGKMTLDNFEICVNANICDALNRAAAEIDAENQNK